MPDFLQLAFLTLCGSLIWGPYILEAGEEGKLSGCVDSSGLERQAGAGQAFSQGRAPCPVAWTLEGAWEHREQL